MTKTLKIYGLDYCSTVQKARGALESVGWQIDFREVKADPLSPAEWQQMLDHFGEKLVNPADIVAINSAILKTSSLVLEFWRVSPLTFSEIGRFSASATALL